MQLAVADLVAEVGDATVLMTDLCLDEYTDHGHCGVLVESATGELTVDNDATLAALRRRSRLRRRTPARTSSRRAA